MSNDTSWNAIVQYSFLRVFANDATIDAGELEMLKRLALRDEKVDAREAEVLGRIFGRVSQDTVEPAVWEEICRFKAEHGIA